MRIENKIGRVTVEVVCQKDLTPEEVNLVIDLWKEDHSLIPHEIVSDDFIRLYPPLYPTS